MVDKKSPEVKYYYRTLQELRDNKVAPFSDPHNFWGAINENKKEAFLNNITDFDPNEICQIIALVDGVAAGYLTLYTGYALINGVKTKVQHGSDLYTLPEYRKYMIGAEMLLLSKDLQQMPGIFAGLSEYAKPLYPKMGFKLLSYPRYVYIYRNRIIVEHSKKISRSLKKLVSWGLDIWHYQTRLRTYKKIAYLQQYFNVELVNEIPDEIEAFINNKSKKYQELHDKRWFEYVLNYTFEINKDESIKNKKLYLVKDKDKIVGFFIIRYRNSSLENGVFNNLLSAEVKEWESFDYSFLSEAEICYLAIAAARKEKADSIAFSIFNSETQNVIEANFKRQGTYDVAIYFPGRKKADAIFEAANWRVRDGYSDTLID